MRNDNNHYGNDNNHYGNDNHGNDVSIGRESVNPSTMDNQNDTIKIVRDSGIQSTSIEMGRASPHNLKVKRKKNHVPKHINTMNEKMIDEKINDEITGDDLTFTHSINSDSDDDYILPDQFIISENKE
jgi:hypothetical protein